MRIEHFDVTVHPTDGNAFSILGATVKAMRRAGATEEQVKHYRASAMSGDYDHLLQITMEWVDLEPSE